MSHLRPFFLRSLNSPNARRTRFGPGVRPCFNCVIRVSIHAAGSCQKDKKMARSALLNVMVQAAMKAGRSLARDFGEVQNLQVSLKGPGDYVSQADRRAEKIVYTELSRARPDFGFLMEESGEVASRTDSTAGWSIRSTAPPISCTAFRSLQSPSLWSVRDRSLRASSTIPPWTSFTPLNVAAALQRPPPARCIAQQAGRFRHRHRHSASGPRPSWPLSGRTAQRHGRNRWHSPHGAVALDLAYVAAGRLDGFWEDGMHPWDIGAGLLMVREAGASSPTSMADRKCSTTRPSLQAMKPFTARC